MNNIFDIKRFGAYLWYEITRAKNNYLISGLVISLMPLVAFTTTQLFALAINRSFAHGLNPYLGIACLSVAIFVIVLTFPTKMYGGLTDKRVGSNYILLPASQLEKWLSMLVVTCVVLPIFFCILFFGVDAILSLIFPSLYGESLISSGLTLGEQLQQEIGQFMNINFSGMTYLEWCENILVFTLGAIYFKKSKAAKTLLCLIGLGMVVSWASIGLIMANTDGIEQFFINLDQTATPESLSLMLNTWMNVWYIAAFIFLLGLTFLRIKTLKH